MPFSLHLPVNCKSHTDTCELILFLFYDVVFSQDQIFWSTFAFFVLILFISYSSILHYWLFITFYGQINSYPNVEKINKRKENVNVGGYSCDVTHGSDFSTSFSRVPLKSRAKHKFVTLLISYLSVLLSTLSQHNSYYLSLIHIWRCRRYAVCRSRWSPYH